MLPITKVWQNNKKWNITSSKLSIILSVLTLSLYNINFWSFLLKEIPLSSFRNGGLIVAFFLLAFALLNLFFNLLLIPKVGKLLISLLFIINSIVVYFMFSFKALVDKNMMLNILESDLPEVLELLSLGPVFSLFFLGIIPVLFFYKKIEINFQPFYPESKQKLINIITSVFFILLLFLGMNKKFTFFFRAHREIKHYFVPLNYLDASRAIFKKAGAENIIREKISQDATLNSSFKVIKNKTIIVLVIGETARFKNFSINGYKRETNPLLAKENIISFQNVSSCGTATAISLPCMFSHHPKSSFNSEDIYRYDNLLDFYQKAGFQVFWRDNNTGCKGVCDRAQHLELRHDQDKNLCNKDICWDEIMLKELDQVVEKNGDKILIVMHQLGSHGPAYNKHIPPSFHHFPNSCNKGQLIDCSQEQIASAYDNTILYTDYFLSKTINFLKKYNEANTAMIYISDHGESLGEKGVYLHGLPYMIAPKEQTHIPFFLWLSSSFQNVFHLDQKCLQQSTHRSLSHDNLFHSLLGLAKIETQYKEKDLDIFSPCTTGPI